MLITEDNFIEQAQLGNEKALEYILATYGWVIKTVVKKHLYHLQSHQEECINDILMAIWSNITRFDPDKSTFKNWVAAISKYKSIDYLRKYLKDLEHENIDDIELREEDHVSIGIIQDNMDEQVAQLLDCLSTQDRALFMKLYVQEQDMQQVCFETGMKKDVIYNRLSRAKKKIRQLFEQTNQPKSIWRS